MIGLTIFSSLLVYGADRPIYDIFSDGDFSYSSVNGSIVVNSTKQDFDVEGYSFSSGIDVNTGLLAVIVASVVVAVLAGITVVSSGLDTFSVSYIVKVTLLYGLWLMLSVIGMQGLLLIPVFGWVIYFMISFTYTFGVIDYLRSS